MFDILISYIFNSSILFLLLKVGGDEDSEEEVGMGGPSKLDSEGEDEKSEDE